MQWLVRRFILPIAGKRAWKSFCEIGACDGRSSDEMLSLPNISYTIIDPCFDADLVLKYAGDPRVKVRKGNSLVILPELAGIYDCFLFDGDHNWYTVMNELRLIRQRGMLRPGGMIFFHDVGWTFGRRDMYYQPETIPPQYRHKYERKGIVPGRKHLVDSGGECPDFCNAVHEGGPKNGVLTAIEDFVAEHPSDYHFCRVRFEAGLGILQLRRKRLSEDISFLPIRIKAGILSLYGLLPPAIRRLLTPTFWRLHR